jgi:protein-disulfide isomerase
MTQARKSASAAGRRRAPLIVAAVVAAAIVVGVLVAVSASGGDDGGNAARGGGTVLGVEEVRAELLGLKQSGTRLGSADATVRVEEFADMQCPFCARASSAYVPEIIERFVRPGRVSLTFRTMAFIGEDSRRGALAVHAAARQNRMWDLVGVLYLNQGKENEGWLSDRLVSDVADALGIDRSKLDADRGSTAVAEALAEDEQSAASSGIQSTPTFVVTGPGGREVLKRVESADAIAAAIERVRR